MFINFFKGIHIKMLEEHIEHLNRQLKEQSEFIFKLMDIIGTERK